jgi:hypothetical protein
MRTYLIDEGFLMGIQHNLARFGFPLSVEETAGIITPTTAILGMDYIEPISTEHHAALIVCVAMALLTVGQTRGFAFDNTRDLAFRIASGIYDLKEELSWENDHPEN